MESSPLSHVNVGHMNEANGDSSSAIKVCNQSAPSQCQYADSVSKDDGENSTSDGEFHQALEVKSL